jgi:hypothetical protein
MRISPTVIRVHLRVDMPLRAVVHLIILFSLISTSPMAAADRVDSVKDDGPKLIAPAVSTGTGLLLEPALTLPEFTREKFVVAHFGIRGEWGSAMDIQFDNLAESVFEDVAFVTS